MALLKVNTLQLNGKKNPISLPDQKSAISVDLKTVIFEMDIDDVWGGWQG